jgi:hypothetical protein
LAVFASNQIGNLMFCSTSPPAPSSTVRFRCSTRIGLLAISLIGTRNCPLSLPPSPGRTSPP